MSILMSTISLLIWEHHVASFHLVPRRDHRRHVPHQPSIVTNPGIKDQPSNPNSNLFGQSCNPTAHHHHSRASPSSSRSPSSCLFQSSGNNNNSKGNKNLSNAERERRDEEVRRQQRKDDVVINKTSAKRGAKDYPIDPKATEEEYLRQASKVERDVFQLTEEGMEALKSLQLDEADLAFRKVYELRPNAYVWQAGIVKFYLGDFVGAAEILARSCLVYEKRFGSPASEERIWRDACELRYLNLLPRKVKKELDAREGGVGSVIPRIPADDDSDGATMPLGTESRKVVKLVRDLFAAAIEPDASGSLMSQAQLRSIGGSFDDMTPGADKKMRRLYSWFYLGLYHDVMGDREAGKKCMKMALQLSPSPGKSSDIMQTLPILHMTVRDWFDDDEFEDDPMESGGGDDILDEVGSASEFSVQKPSFQQTYSDPVVEASIMEGVGKMKSAELREALRIRGLKTGGSKEALQERLFFSLMDDVGFQSGFAP